MKVIVITKPEFFPGEATVVNALFVAGLEILHLRKPEATLRQMEQFVVAINAEYRDRVVLHSHYGLIEKYNLRGAHLSALRSFNPEEITGTVSLSYSCHSLAEVNEQKSRCAYVFLSPIFNSISKQGYAAAFTHEELADAHARGIIDNKVVALGGITPDRLPFLQNMGFGGVALLGDIWQNADPIVRLSDYLA